MDNKIRRFIPMPLKVKDAMVKQVITVDEEATVKEAARIMNKFEIGCLIVSKDGKATGILTERDLLKKIISKGKSPARTKVSSIMTTPLIVVEPEMDLEEAAKLMFKLKIKKLPVIDRGQLKGLVTLSDLLRFQPHLIRLIKDLSKQLAPKRMKKVVNYYVV